MKIKNTLINTNILKKYLRINRRQIYHDFSNKKDLLKSWKKKLKDPVKSDNFYDEVRNYPYFRTNFLEKFLDYELTEDIDFENPNHTTEGVEEFIIKDKNKDALLLIELKGQKTQDLDRPQPSYRNKSPVQQAHGYAINSKANWYVVFNYDELRIYNKFEGYIDENYISFKISEESEEDIFFLLLLLSKRFFKEEKILEALINETIVVEREVSGKLYKLYHETRLILIRQLNYYNPGFTFHKSITYAQLIMNRIIFICFAEDRGLLPSQILTSIIQILIEKKFIKRKRCAIWKAINDLFIDINEGHYKRTIPEFNGELFKDNLDGIKIPDLLDKPLLEDFSDLLQDHEINDKNVDNIIKGYQTQTDGYLNPIFIDFLLLSTFDYNSEIDVNILGHIFEQSLTDLEELHTNLSLEIKEQKSKKKRKEEGIYYTPDYITDYICRNTIIPYLSKANKNSTDELLEEYSDRELDLLIDKINNIKILDLACGSGAFLRQAFKVLVEIHKLIKLRRITFDSKEEDGEETESAGVTSISTFLEEKTFTFVDPEVKINIVSNSIFGIDKNDESIGITKLSLFLEVAAKGKKLPDLSNNIKCGNSLIEDLNKTLDEKATKDLKAFNWQNEFKEVMNNDGFDIIIGNPPYIRHEDIGDEKDFLEGNFEIYNGIADLYCYFYEKGLKILKENGILGYITSNKWIKKKYGLNLRQYINKFFIEKFINFFELKVFKDVSTEPAIIVLKKTNKTNKNIEVTLVESLQFQNLSQYIDDHAFWFDQDKLEDNSWNFSKDIVQIEAILDKMKKDSINLSEFLGENQIRRGLMTGKVPVYVINNEKYMELIREDPKSQEIIRPLINGIYIHKYVYEFKEDYIIVPKIGTDIKKYPAIEKYLLKHKEELENRHSGSKGNKWFELRRCAYYNNFEKPKIVYIYTAKDHHFAIDINNCYLINTSYFIDSDDRYLLAFLNSNLFEFYKINTFAAFGDARTRGRCNLDHNKMKKVPIIKISKSKHNQIKEMVDLMIKKKTDLLFHKSKFLDFIRANYRIPKLSQKIENFWMLNSSDFLDEVKKKKKLSVKDLKGLSDLFLEILDNKINPLIKEIGDIEREINEFFFNICKINQEEKKFIKEFLRK